MIVTCGENGDTSALTTLFVCELGVAQQNRMLGSS